MSLANDEATKRFRKIANWIHIQSISLNCHHSQVIFQYICIFSNGWTFRQQTRMSSWTKRNMITEKKFLSNVFKMSNKIKRKFFLYCEDVDEKYPIFTRFKVVYTPVFMIYWFQMHCVFQSKQQAPNSIHLIIVSNIAHTTQENKMELLVFGGLTGKQAQNFLI